MIFNYANLLPLIGYYLFVDEKVCKVISKTDPEVKVPILILSNDINETVVSYNNLKEVEGLPILQITIKKFIHSPNRSTTMEVLPEVGQAVVVRISTRSKTEQCILPVVLIDTYYLMGRHATAYVECEYNQITGSAFYQRIASPAEILGFSL